jgi:glycosyltransferase involved in cell wall biosynthesis
LASASTTLDAPPASGPRGRSRTVVCQIVHTLNVGGAELLARQFAERGRDEFDFVFACLDEPGSMADELRRAGFPVEILGRRPGFDFSCVRRLAACFRRHDVRVVHAHQYAPFFYAALARLVGWRRLPIVFTEHGRDYPDFRRSKRVLANRALVRRGDRVIGVGQYVRQALIANEGLRPDKVEVIYNGIDVAAYQSSPASRRAARAALRLADDEVAVVQVARLNPLKDHATAIHALAHLAASHPLARLLVVGDGEERPRIEALIAELGLARQVRILGTRRDVADLLAAADVFLLSSVSEGIPLTLIEAMAAGLPCVSTAVGGTPEVILDGQTGLLARAGDPADLATKLAIVLDDADLRSRLGSAGRERSRRHFSDADMHASYHAIYRDLAGQTSRSPAAAGRTP